MSRRHALWLLLGLTLPGWPGGAAAGQPAPRLVCPAPVYDFGTVPDSGEITHEFVIRNAGQAPLKIHRVAMPCGCMLLRLRDDTLPPGGETSLRACLPLRGLAGFQRKRILLHTNDPDQPRATLVLGGAVIPELDLQPRELFWGNLREDAAVTKAVAVAFHAGAGQALAATCSLPFLAVALERGTNPAAGRVTLRTLPPLPRGAFQGALTIRTDHPRWETITVPLSGRVVGEWFVIPDELVLAPGDQPVVRTILVRSSNREKFSVLRVEPPAPGIGVRLRPGALEGHRIELSNLRPVPELDGGRVLIVTDHPRLAALAVPVRLAAPAGAP